MHEAHAGQAADAIIALVNSRAQSPSRAELVAIIIDNFGGSQADRAPQDARPSGDGVSETWASSPLRAEWMDLRAAVMNADREAGDIPGSDPAYEKAEAAVAGASLRVDEFAERVWAMPIRGPVDLIVRGAIAEFISDQVLGEGPGGGGEPLYWLDPKNVADAQLPAVCDKVAFAHVLHGVRQLADAGPRPTSLITIRKETAMPKTKTRKLTPAQLKALKLPFVKLPSPTEGLDLDYWAPPTVKGENGLDASFRGGLYARLAIKHMADTKAEEAQPILLEIIGCMVEKGRFWAEFGDASRQHKMVKPPDNVATGFVYAIANILRGAEAAGIVRDEALGYATHIERSIRDGNAPRCADKSSKKGIAALRAFAKEHVHG